MTDLVHRPTELARLLALLEEFPVVGVLGARQVGKTTLAQELGDQLAMPVTAFSTSRTLATSRA